MMLHTESGGSRVAQRFNNGAATRGLTRVLGWFSVGLGLAEALAPRGISKMIGVRDGAASRTTLRALGMRELVNGIALLAGKRRGPWLWARVFGDVVDLGLLGFAMRSKRRRKSWLGLGIAGFAVAGVTALDVLAAERITRGLVRFDPHVGDHEVSRVITIARSPEEVYGCWRNVANLARFMSHVESIEPIDERRSHWRVCAPAGAVIEYDAEIVEDRPNECISWRSLPGGDVESSGTVRFERAPGDRGTEVHVRMHYAAPAGKLGVAIAKLFGEEPGQQIAADLRHLKQVLETGEIVHSDASIHPRMHAARPRNEEERLEVIP
jgi:uncharacterized membrane protein